MIETGAFTVKSFSTKRVDRHAVITIKHDEKPNNKRFFNLYKNENRKYDPEKK